MLIKAKGGLYLKSQVSWYMYKAKKTVKFTLCFQKIWKYEVASNNNLAV